MDFSVASRDLQFMCQTFDNNPAVEMIVSASYRTDIPAFYAEWLGHRLRAGYCLVTNPYSGRPYRVDLPGDGFVFWTRNIAPLFPLLEEYKTKFPFYVTFTITAYPRALERSVIPTEIAIEQMRRIANQFGGKACVWRYDPIVISSLTPPGWHRRNFASLANMLRGVTDEVVVSFLHPYRKTRRNMQVASSRHGFTWRDPEVDEKKALLEELVSIAEENGLTIRLCCQPELQVPGLVGAVCVDTARLGVAGGRVKGNRPGCLCYASRDIGSYDTCPHGCVYCYAVSSRSKAVQAIERHDTEGLGL